MFVVFSRAAASFGARVLPHPPKGGVKQLTIKELLNPPGKLLALVGESRRFSSPTVLSAIVIWSFYITTNASVRTEENCKKMQGIEKDFKPTKKAHEDENCLSEFRQQGSLTM